MPAPSDVIRSYGGGAVASQLIESMGPTDTSFAINPTTGWTEADGNPLGTVGPFVVVIDRFTDTVEKILCSSINLVTGLVTVYTSSGYSGRGYDGSTPQAHVPGGSTSGVQTCWSSVEAVEANSVVFKVLGQLPAPSTGEVFTWTASGPEWVAPPAGIAGYTQITTPPALVSSGTPASVAGLSTSVTVAAGQLVKITAYSYIISGNSLATTDQYGWYIVEGSTVLNAAAVLSDNFALVIAVVTSSAGSHTYQVQASHLAGAAAGSIGASATQPAFILAEVL